MTKKIGIFAGTFDPIHDGHLAVAEQAVVEVGLAQLIFMVEEKPWSHKQPITLEHRQKMVSLAIDKIATFSQLFLDDERFSVEKTLPTLQKKYNNAELHFLFGSDVFLRMDSSTWPTLHELLKHQLIVFLRSSTNKSDVLKHARNLGITVTILRSKHPHHSSSDVRLKPHDTALWVPASVADYIKTHSLY